MSNPVLWDLDARGVATVAFNLYLREVDERLANPGVTASPLIWAKATFSSSYILPIL